MTEQQETTETGRSGGGRYGDRWTWNSAQIGLRAATPLLAELAGAGVVGADAEDAYWRGYSSESH